MHVHFEQNTCTRTDSDFLSLSWMGKVPEDLPEEGGGWKLDRSQYYVEGWLANGNARGVVGVTFSTSHCHGYDAPPRSNFNLRGHRSEVVLVRWNEPYQKLATCDSLGVIFVWIKHEGRWSIELINDRNSQVTDFAWSHDGRMALICYRDGFILVGSVAGQRYWSSMLNPEGSCITCGVWSPDDSQVMFGTTDGKIVVMSSAGTVVAHVAVHEGFDITGLVWSCDRFNMEEADSSKYGNGGDQQAQPRDRNSGTKSHVLAVSFKYGDIFLMSGYDDICPVMIYTTLTGIKMDWSNCGEYLAVGGFVRMPNLQVRNEINFYSKEGNLIHYVTIPSLGKPLTAMTWGHNDKRLFAAAGRNLYVAWVSKQVAPLQFLCQRVLHKAVRTEKAVERLPLPQRLQCGVKALFSPTVKSYIPDPLRLREFVCSPPPGGERLFCTMIRQGEETSGGHYTLYLEYLGGLVPLLKGKRASKLRPDFVIYDPKIKSSSSEKGDQSKQSSGGGKGGGVLVAIESDTSSESDAEVYMDGCGSPRMQRRRRHKTFRAEKVNRSITFRTLDELMYDDNLPETNRLVEVTSNIWATKFQMTGVSSSLPSCLGQVVYKTSLLRLQPRQMTVSIAEVLPSRHTLSRDPNFTPAPISDDDETSCCTSEGDLVAERKTVEVYDTSHSHVADVTTCRRTSFDRESSSIESPLMESRFHAVNGVDYSMENVSPVACVGGMVAGKLGGSGTVRSRSLSPVRNSLTQTAPAFKQDSLVGAGDHHTCAGDNTLLLASTNGSSWQGARPKANSLGDNDIVLSPILGRAGGGEPIVTVGNCNKWTSNKRCSNNSDSSGTVVQNNISNISNNDSCSRASGNIINTANNFVISYHSPPKLGSNAIISNSSNCVNNSPAFSSHPSSPQYAISSSGPVQAIAPGTNHVDIHPQTSCMVPNPTAGKVQDGSSTGYTRTCPRAVQGSNIELVNVSPQTLNLDLKVTTDPKGFSTSPHINSCAGASRWADPAVEAIHLLTADAPGKYFDSNSVDEASEKESSSYSSVPAHQQQPLQVKPNTLIADCSSPTAPYSLDRQRRLYLAQHTSLPDSGAPISPSGCPSCLPQPLKSSTRDENLLSIDLCRELYPRMLSAQTSLSDSVLQNNVKNATSPLASHSHRISSDVSSGIITNDDLSKVQPTTSVLISSPPVSGDDEVSRGMTPHPVGIVRHSKSDTAYTQNNVQSSTNSSKSLLASYFLNSGCLPSVLSCQHPSFNGSLDDENLPFPTHNNMLGDQSCSNKAELTESTTNTIHVTPASSHPHTETAYIQVHSSTQTPSPQPLNIASTTNAVSSTSTSIPALPSNSSSLDKLALILSEAPTAHLNSHNFRSMPGFVMKNPELAENTTDSHQDVAGFDSLLLSPPPSPTPKYRLGNQPANSDLDIQVTSASLPSSPIRYIGRGGNADDPRETIALQEHELLKGRCKHLSPMLGRKHNNNSLGSRYPQNEAFGSDQRGLGQGYVNYELFLKTRLKQKNEMTHQPYPTRRRQTKTNGRLEQTKMFTMHNKAPLWNETSQVYQLDFGGRVTQESAKNFQIELKGKQVMQFGRIDNHAYTLDFQYPFTAVQAFAVALANVTQRLK